MFQTKEALNVHSAKCNTEGMHFDRTVMSRAGTLAFEALTDGTLKLYRNDRISPFLRDVVVFESVIVRCMFRVGWARRPKNGKTLGSNNAGEFMREIEEWYMEGARDKGKKMSAAMMLSALETNYRDRYDLPSEQHIVQAIWTINKKYKSRHGVVKRTESADHFSEMGEVGGEGVDEGMVEEHDQVPHLFNCTEHQVQQVLQRVGDGRTEITGDVQPQVVRGADTGRTE